MKAGNTHMNDEKLNEQTSVYATRNYMEAMMIKTLLNSNGIDAAVHGEINAECNEFTRDKFRELTIAVAEEQAEEAVRIIKEYGG